jgi:hypothetical protein
LTGNPEVIDSSFGLVAIDALALSHLANIFGRHPKAEILTKAAMSEKD